LISSNHLTWNSNVKEEDDDEVSEIPKFKKNIQIKLFYNHNAHTLTFIIGDFKKILTGVYFQKGVNLVPCALLLNVGDCVEFQIS
jgi:hypothetical protein